MLALAVVLMYLICKKSGDIELDDEDWRRIELLSDDRVGQFVDGTAECPLNDGAFWKLYFIQVGIAIAVRLIMATLLFSGVLSWIFCNKPGCMIIFGGRRAAMRAEEGYGRVAADEEAEGPADGYVSLDEKKANKISDSPALLETAAAFTAAAF